MMLTKVLPYFRDCLCSIGLEEWNGDVNSEEPPNTTIERNFTLQLGNILVEPVNHTSFTYEVPVTVVIYTKTYRSQIEGVDCLIEKAEEVNCCLLEVTKRYGGCEDPLKSISPESISFEPISVTNDNVLKAVMDFNVRLEIEYRE